MVYETLFAMLSAAVDDERIPRNPAKGAQLAKIDAPPFVPLTAEQVHAIAQHTSENVHAAVILAAGTGLRQGELFGVTHDRIDFLRRELRVDQHMRVAAKAANLEGHTWHDLRHHHASVLLSHGVSPALVAERIGDDVKTLLTTYAHVIRADDDRVRAIVDASLGVSAVFSRTETA
jgi:integrase